MATLFGSAPVSASLLGGLQLLLDLALKSVIVMMAAWLAASLLRKASAATRHWVWGASVIGLLALPALSLVLPNWQLGWLPSLAQRNLPAAVSRTSLAKEKLESGKGNAPGMDATNLENQSSAKGAEMLADPPFSTSPPIRFEFDSNPTPPAPLSDQGWPLTVPEFVRTINWGAMALLFWMAGALLVILRLLAGTVRIWRLAHLAADVTESTWISLSHNIATKLRLRTKVELRKSEQVRLPMTWGAWRSVVMLPAEADRWPQECRSIVLLHELAHVKRRDCLTQNLAQLACALYWFNPLVWLAARQLHVERELACDDRVLEVGTKASDYASHLVEIARSFNASLEQSPVAVGMACSQLESRVRSILDPGIRRRGLNRLTAGLIGLGAICLIAALAITQPWSKTEAAVRSAEVKEQTTGRAGEVPASPSVPNTPGQALLPPSMGEGSKDLAESLAESTERSARESRERRDQEMAEDPSESREQDAGQTSASAQTKSSELTADQLIEMKTAGVTPEFIEAMRKQGFDNLTARELVQLSIHGINADYIKQARSWGGDKITIREIVNLKIAGVTPEYISAMKQGGYDGLTARQLSELRIQGVMPAFVEAMRRLGYDKLTPNQLASLKIQGVDEAFVKEMQNWTGSKPTVNELLQIRIHGVTPDFARRMKALGYDNLSINKLTEMRIHGVDEQFVKEMRGLGFDNLTVDQLIKMKIHGVTPEYVKKMRAAGLKNVSVNQMIEMKITGIDAILLKEKR